MGRIIAIVGLPASGKTHYARKLAVELEAVIIDDPKEWNKDIAGKIEDLANETFILTDPWLCIDRNRVLAEDKFRKLGFPVEWIFFANDPEQCKVNDPLRGTDRASDISWFSTQYSIPEGANVLPVWK
jgi:hypothetical protein